MKLKNYTSNVAVEKSIFQIETMLVKAGATHIAKFYDNQRTAGFIFQIPIEDKNLTFKLPANPLAVKRIMEGEVRRPRKGTMNKVWDQAERTAWRILADWVHLQVTMIQMEQAESIQIFLPYIYDGKTDQTLFEKVKNNNFKLLGN